MPDISTRIKVHKGFSKKKIMMYGFTLNDLEILDWIEQLVTRNEGIQKGRAMFTRNLSEHSGLNQDMETHIYYWVDKPESVGETFRYHMINYDKMMADMPYIANDQRTYAHHLDRLCGTKDKKSADLRYPLSKIVRHTRFGKKSFFCINPAIVIYMREEEDNMNDLFDDKVQPVKDLPRKEYSPLSEEFLSFYKKACRIYDFKHKLPKDNESPSAILAKSQEYFEAILANKFSPKLKKPCDVDLSDASPKLILKALMRYVEWMEVNRPKEKLSLDTFFYNPKQMMSYFLINYSMEATERRDNAEREDNREFMNTEDTPYFDELWDDLSNRCSYANINTDKVVHNSFYRLFLQIEADSEKFDAANTHCRFLERVFWPMFLDNLIWKEVLVKDDFDLNSKRCAGFVAKMTGRYGYKIFMENEDHDANVALWKRVDEEQKQIREMKEKSKNVNKSIDELDGVMVDLTKEEQDKIREQTRCNMLQTIGMMLDDLFYYENNKGMSFEEVERKYKEIGGE